jgi:hypothetical protein
MKAYWVSGSIAPRIFELRTTWRSVVSFAPLPLDPRVSAPGTHWIGGWVGPRTVLDAVVERKIPAPVETRTHDHPTRSLALYH